MQIAANRYRALNSPAAASAPPVNVVETEQACWVVTALPGADANQIESRLHDNELVITGMRRLPTCCAQGEEKVLAAKRAGIGCVLLPELNRKELDEIWPQAREVLLVDDMISTAGTIEKALQAILQAGCSSSGIKVLASHGLLVGAALERLGDLEIERLYISDSVPAPKQFPPPLQVVSIAPLLAEAIHRLNENESMAKIIGSP